MVENLSLTMQNGEIARWDQCHSLEVNLASEKRLRDTYSLSSFIQVYSDRSSFCQNGRKCEKIGRTRNVRFQGKNISTYVYSDDVGGNDCVISRSTHFFCMRSYILLNGTLYFLYIIRFVILIL